MVDYSDTNELEVHESRASRSCCTNMLAYIHWRERVKHRLTERHNRTAKRLEHLRKSRIMPYLYNLVGEFHVCELYTNETPIARWLSRVPLTNVISHADISYHLDSTLVLNLANHLQIRASMAEVLLGLQ